jgi:hypothetical protein
VDVISEVCKTNDPIESVPILKIRGLAWHAWINVRLATSRQDACQPSPARMSSGHDVQNHWVEQGFVVA